jgi:hypothetical protein
MKRFQHTTDFPLIVVTFLLSPGGHCHFNMLNEQYTDMLLSQATKGLGRLAEVFNINPVEATDLFQFYLHNMTIPACSVSE